MTIWSQLSWNMSISQVVPYVLTTLFAIFAICVVYKACILASQPYSSLEDDEDDFDEDEDEDEDFDEDFDEDDGFDDDDEYDFDDDEDDEDDDDFLDDRVAA